MYFFVCVVEGYICVGGVCHSSVLRSEVDQWSFVLSCHVGSRDGLQVDCQAWVQGHLHKLNLLGFIIVVFQCFTCLFVYVCVEITYYWY